MTDTFGQGLACASLAQFGLQWIDRVEELLGEAEALATSRKTPTLTPGSPDSSFQSVGLEMPARWATCSAVRFCSFRHSTHRSPRVLAARRVRAEIFRAAIGSPYD